MPYDYKGHFGEIAMTHDLTTLPGERTWRLAAPGRDTEHHRIVLYLGCNVLRTSHMVQTITAIFDRLGLDYVAVGGPTYCCGIVHHQHWDTAAAGGMAHHTIELFKRFEPEEVVMWCPSCIYFYDEVQRVQMPFPVRHATEFLVARLPELTFSREVRARVALHYHTQSEPRRREGLAGRRLLEAVPGLRAVEVEPTERFGRICTPAVQQQLGLEAWNGLVRDEIDRARAAGADTLATIYHGCQRLICGFEAHHPIAIEHYLSVFARGLGLEFEDKYKKYRLWQDPDRILADMTPCQLANDVNPARARELVERAFGSRALTVAPGDSPPS
ncbi:MAG: (Fe-S)-binding protein [Candidatus Rokubacteria bacterium]|nr:(Fe-S)-binding protein [Candidatus Rokubacteria bacterium]